MRSHLKPKAVLQALASHIGKDNGVSAVDLYRSVTGEDVSDGVAARSLRAAIVELRLAGQHVCAHPSRGYYIAADAAELEETCDFLTSRALKSLAQVSAMTKRSMIELIGQRRLPT